MSQEPDQQISLSRAMQARDDLDRIDELGEEQYHTKAFWCQRIFEKYLMPADELRAVVERTLREHGGPDQRREGEWRYLSVSCRECPTEAGIVTPVATEPGSVRCPACGSDNLDLVRSEVGPTIHHARGRHIF